MSRPGRPGRRKARPHIARHAAPAAFLLGVTIAVLLIRSGLGGGSPSTTTVGPVTHPTTTSATTTKRGSTTARGTRYYTVQRGDTFGSISSKTGASIAELERLNPGVSSNTLQVGQKLRVK